MVRSGCVLHAEFVGGWTRRQLPVLSHAVLRILPQVRTYSSTLKHGKLKGVVVDGPITDYFRAVVELSISMLCKFAAVVLMSPVFLIPGALVAIVGGWLGQIYMKAQLSVKREMSNARAPVLGHFGAAIAGLSAYHQYSKVINTCSPSHSVDQSIRRAGRLHKGGICSQRSLDHRCAHLL